MCECLLGFESRITGEQSLAEIMQYQVSCEDINECEVKPEASNTNLYAMTYMQ